MRGAERAAKKRDELSEAVMERRKKIIPNGPSVFPTSVPFSLFNASNLDMLVESL